MFNQTVYAANAAKTVALDCDVPVNERNLYYEGRCRPWYLASMAQQNSTVINPPYLCALGGGTCITLSDALLQNGVFFGVTATDLAVDLLSRVFRHINSTGVADAILFMAPPVSTVLFSQTRRDFGILTVEEYFNTTGFTLVSQEGEYSIYTFDSETGQCPSNDCKILTFPLNLQISSTETTKELRIALLLDYI